MIGFLSLPREIRNMVYEMALVVDKVLIPYDEHYALEKQDLRFRKALPTVALLGVSKLVQLEAVEYLYSRNTWRISSTAPTLFTLPGRENLWTLRAQYFKHVVTVFDLRDVNGEDLHAQLCSSRRYLPELNPEKRMKDAHSMGEMFMNGSWYTKIDSLTNMPNLESLSVDVSRLACHVGCCREAKLWDLLELFVLSFGSLVDQSLDERVKVGLELTISGLHGKAEEEILKASKFPATIV